MKEATLKRTVFITFVAGACCAVSAAPARAQHGVTIGKSCVRGVCPGDATDCQIFLGHADFFGDTIVILEAWDVMDSGLDGVRVPDVGNLPIVAVFGNTTCTVGGSLPCNVGPLIPGKPEIQPGVVIFASNTYVIQPDDRMPLLDQANVRVADACDSPTTNGCAILPSLVQFTASTSVPNCDDLSLCTTDSCEEGVCIHGDVNCDDDNRCTADSCLPARGCQNIPECTGDLDCNDNDACTLDTCTVSSTSSCCVASGGLGCDDAKCQAAVCAADPFCCDTAWDATCASEAIDLCAGLCPHPGCCMHDPVVCDDQNPCTTDTCDMATGCVYTPECLKPADCNDGNACTTDLCNAQGCCEYEPVICADDNPCTTASCDPATGCVFTPECQNAGDCDDGILCKSDICTEQGCCQHVEACNDFDPCTVDVCDPQTGGCSISAITCVCCAPLPCHDDPAPRGFKPVAQPDVGLDCCFEANEETCDRLPGSFFHGHEIVGCREPQACCLETSCVEVSPVCCVDYGGTPMGEGSTCDLQGCCVGDHCFETDGACCAASGGTPLGSGTPCNLHACKAAGDPPAPSAPGQSPAPTRSPRPRK